MALGDRFTDESRLTRLLMQQPNYNNGSVYGGLAHVLNQGLLGYSSRKDSENQEAATRALLEGMGARPFVNPDTGDQMGTAGGYEGAIYALQNQQGNPYAGRLASQLMMGQAQAGMEDQRWENRFERQNAAEMERFQAQQAAQDQRFQQQLAAQRELAQMRAEQDRATAGKYYAVPSGDGYFLIDKASGMAVRMGMDASGNPVQIGAPFQPAFNPGTGQPTPLPVPPGGPQMMPGAPQPNAGMQPPAGMPTDPNAAVQPPGMPQQPAGDLRPVMPPSVDPRAQYDVSSAKKAGQLEGERIGSMPERLKAAQQAMQSLETQNTVVRQDIQRAINLAKTGGGPVGTTGFGSVLAGIPGTDAANLSSLLETIKANIGFDKLQAMREASPTGGALGQVAIQELVALQASLGALQQSQTQDQFVSNLERLDQVLAAQADFRRAAFDRDFGEQSQQFTPQQNMQPQQPQRRRYNPATGQIE